MTTPDRELATRFRDNADEDAFDVLYERYAPGLHDFLVRVVRNGSAAEDLTQLAFIRAWEKRADMREPGRFKSWLFTLGYRLALDAVTGERAPARDIAEETDLADPGDGPERELVRKEAAELVWAAASSLEPRQYAVLDLAVRHGLTTPEIGAAIGVDGSHAAVLLTRAKEALGNAVRYLMVARRRDHCVSIASHMPAQPAHSVVPAGHASPAPATRESYLTGWPLPPQCPTSAADASVCQVALPRNGSLPHPGPGRYQAAAGESLLIRIGWADATSQSCDAYASGVTTTFTLDGQPLDVTTVPCTYFTSNPNPSSASGISGAQWWTDVRFLTSPLRPGTHVAGATTTYNVSVPYWSACSGTPPCHTPAGEVDRWEQLITVT